MCGIAGAILWGNGPDAELDGFDIAHLAYRGPDALCTTRSAEIADPPRGLRWKLSHARLSILDLAVTANQPMSSTDGRYWLVFNGEIYNHRPLRQELEGMGFTFRTDHSDSEVLLNACIAWGPEALARLNGMFAFVLLDNRTGRAWGARDRMGIKPLYYRMAGGTFTFASEPKGILGKRTVDRDALLQYFRFLQVEGARTFYESINKLPAAHFFEIDEHGRMRTERYWHPLQGNRGRDLVDVASCFDLLKDAVDLQMEADVEVGTYLSGGLDSSVITALASRGRQVNAFSIGFDDSVPGYVSELPYAKLVAQHVGARHFPITISPAEYLAAQERAFKVLDEPIADTACGPLLLLSELARTNGVTVCLSGEGSDELFIGYRHWHDAYLVDRWLRRMPKAAVRAYLAIGAPGLAGRKPDWVRWARRRMRGRFILWGGTDAIANDSGGQMFNARFLAEALNPYAAVQRNLILPDMRHADFLQRVSALDLQFRLPENLLARVDRMSMAASLEARVPFLDHRLVETAMRIPVDQLVSSQGEKLALKNFARQILPSSIIERKKDGFTIPLHEILNAAEAMRQKELILGMDDELRIYSNDFRTRIGRGEVTGKDLWPHYALAKWWSIHVQAR